MSSGLLEPSEGEQLCVFLLREAGEEEEEEAERRKEVACQWENPEEEERREERREVGCQSDSAEKRDAAVQVDLLTQQLSLRHTDSSAMLLQCFSVRPDGPNGGPLLQHCTTNQTRTRTRTRTRTVQPPIKLSPEISEPRSRSQKRPPPQSASRKSPAQRRRCRASPEPQQEEEEEDEDEEEEEDEEDDEDEEEEEVVEEDTADPIWVPRDDVSHAATPSALKDIQLNSDSQHAPLPAVKLEPDSTVCDVCGKVMKNKSSLARHSFIHTGRKPFACHLCDLRFNRRDNLQHHLTRLHPNGVTRLEKQRQAPSWLCAACGKTFSCRSRLKTHEVIHSGVKPHRCDLCPKAYMRTNDLQHHKKVVHEGGTAESQRSASLLCDFCGKEFKCRSQLAIHYQTHTGERPHLCDVCGRKFGRHYQLKRHKILLHASRGGGEANLPFSPFTCDICGKRLKSEAFLASHRRVHSGEKPHRCNICLHSYQSATCLKQHHMRVHLRVKTSNQLHIGGRKKSSTSAKTFPCPVCGKVFKFKSLLASHGLTHSEIRPHGCEFCRRTFRRLSHLKRHREVVHANGERLPQSFVCHICGVDKKCRSQLARHAIIHTGERPFACDLCPARFNRGGNLKQHKRRMHGVEAVPSDEPPPILFDDDVMPGLTYKQEETVVAIDAMAAEDCDAAAEDCDIVAAEDCNAASEDCNAASEDCNATSEDCNAASEDCNTASEDCNAASEDCNAASEDCNAASEDCNAASEDCNAASEDCNAASEDCNTASGDCNAASEDCNAASEDCDMVENCDAAAAEDCGVAASEETDALQHLVAT